MPNGQNLELSLSLSLSLFKKKFDYILTADIFYWITSFQIDYGELLFKQQLLSHR